MGPMGRPHDHGPQHLKFSSRSLVVKNQEGACGRRGRAGGARRDGGDGDAPKEVQGRRRRTQRWTEMGVWVGLTNGAGAKAAWLAALGAYWTPRSNREGEERPRRRRCAGRVC